MSGYGPEPTCRDVRLVSPLLGAERTRRRHLISAAIDPQRTFFALKKTDNTRPCLRVWRPVCQCVKHRTKQRRWLVRGQIIDFIATDICRVADGRIAENWHFEEILH
jgi:hypothetical protein